MPDDSQFGTAVQSSLIHPALPVRAVMQERRTLGETVGKYDGKHPRLTATTSGGSYG